MKRTSKPASMTAPMWIVGMTIHELTEWTNANPDHKRFTLAMQVRAEKIAGRAATRLAEMYATR